MIKTCLDLYLAALGLFAVSFVLLNVCSESINQTEWRHKSADLLLIVVGLSSGVYWFMCWLGR